MGGSAVTLDLRGIPEAQKMLGRLSHADFLAEHKAISEALIVDSIEAWDKEADPETGKSWADWSPVTKAAKEKKYKGKRGEVKKKLIGEFALLRKSVSNEATAQSAIIAYNRPYARIHQLGGEAGRRDARVTIPARPYMGEGEFTRSAIEDAIERLTGGAL